ncbi:MAG: HAD-IB family phosphatase, partial [Deltaproteobacteria bacterium]|nr:HAD-IB family phosphatase [Deltaproteobacteria bacterium]
MKRIIFCDFDGTITVDETFVNMLKQFTPEMYKKLVPEMYTLRVTLKDGVRRLLESIPSRRYPEILDNVRSKPIRPGFVEFLDFLEDKDVPFVLVSGGLRGMIETVLGPLVERFQAVYAADLDTSGKYLQVRSEYEGETEVVSKVKVMAKYNPEESIAIGDGVTDLNMAMNASLVFARDNLTKYLDERQKPYIRWDTFFDIRDHLA